MWLGVMERSWRREWCWTEKKAKLVEGRQSAAAAGGVKQTVKFG
jgi:hypothetical protein